MSLTTGLSNTRLDRMVRQSGATMRVIITGKPLARAIDRKTAIVLKQTGGYGRRTMRSLIGKKPVKVGKEPRRKLTKSGQLTRAYERWLARKEKASKPGRPPYKRKGTLHRLTFFAIDRRAGTVVIGPAFFASKRVRPKGNAKSGAQLLDSGGPATFVIENSTGERRTITRTMRPHPYRAPTLEKTLPIFREHMRSVPFV